MARSTPEPKGWKATRMALGIPGSLALLAACQAEHPQSMVHSRGPGAEHIEGLWWLLFWLCTLVFAGTMALTAAALLARRRADREGPPLGAARFIVVSGIAVPAAILVGLILASLRSTAELRIPETRLTVRVVGHQFWWHVEYPELGIVTANEMYVPTAEPVRLQLESADVIHSLWVPNLMGKMDLVPERTNHTWLQAQVPGVFRGQCAEYCGVQHARMALHVIALPPAEFEAWAERAARPRPPPPADGLAHRGHEVFFSRTAGCHACHAIAGTPATSALGPDLTHLASRRTLGAATVPNTRETLARWIADSHVFKRGNLMPATEISSSDLEALVAYLWTLE